MKDARLRILLFVSLFSCVLSHAQSTQESFTKTIEHEGVSVLFSLKPGEIDPQSVHELTLTLTTPQGTRASLPESLDSRFEGFTVSSEYASPDKSERVLLLQPLPSAASFSIRPIAVQVHTPSTNSWFATERIKLPLKDLSEAPPLSAVQTTLTPSWIAPSWRMLLRYSLITLGSLLALFLVFLLVKLLRRQYKILRMTPKERALRELDLLLKRKLPQKGRFEDFYVELTMVVRRYIERRYGIIAPKLTTYEFISRAKENPDFSALTLQKLSDFLENADLIKFAGIRASEETAHHAVDKARDYLLQEEATAPTKKGSKQ